MNQYAASDEETSLTVADNKIKQPCINKKWME